MPSFFKTVVISALLACPTVFVTATGDGKKDENKDKKEEKKEKKSDSNTDKLVKVAGGVFANLDEAGKKAISTFYAGTVHSLASVQHKMIDDELKAVALSKVKEVEDLNVASIAKASSIKNLSEAFENLKKLTEDAAKIVINADDPTLVADFKDKVKIDDTESKFDEKVKPLVARLVTALRSVIEYKAECLLGLCDEKVLKANQEEEKKEAEKNKNKKPEEPKKDDKKDDKLSVDKALKKFESDYVVNVEKEAKKLFAATRIGSLEKKIKDQKDSNRSLALGLGLGLGLGLPFLFGVGIFAAMKAGCLQYNTVA